MSTWTGVDNGGPDSATGTRCSWQMCTVYVSRRFADVGVFLCQEHALWVWSVVNEQLSSGETFDIPDEEPPILRDGPPPMPGYVYYVRTGARIKIGHTKNIYRRLSQYPPDIEVLYIQLGGKQLERSEHLRLRAYLAEGREWFQDRPEVTDLIADMADNTKWQGLLDGNWWRRRKAPPVAIRRHTHLGSS